LLLLLTTELVKIKACERIRQAFKQFHTGSSKESWLATVIVKLVYTLEIKNDRSAIPFKQFLLPGSHENHVLEKILSYVPVPLEARVSYLLQNLSL
jgi:hypothetical protein